jgi:hypothetical protein
MTENGTRWPARLERRTQEKIRLKEAAPTADIISQLIAERDQLPARGDFTGTAVGAYEAGSRISERRMPAGYRKTLVA